MSKINYLTEEKIINKIYLIRGKKIMLDRDLSELYGVSTGNLNKAVKRNIERFPEDFIFRFTKEELRNWIFQFGRSNREIKGLRNLPYAFTEQGVAMLSSVLNSPTAIQVNIQIIRVFTRIRELLSTHKDILLKLEQLEKKMLQHDSRADRHDQEIKTIFNVLKELLNPPVEPRKKIGFRLGKEND